MAFNPSPEDVAKLNSLSCLADGSCGSTRESGRKFPAFSRWLPGILWLVVAAMLGLNPAQAQTPDYTGMVVFGDSLVDVGNTISLFSESQNRTLTGYNPNFYYNNRFSNGPIWVDDLYSSLGLGNISGLQVNDNANNQNGTDFAWGGSRSGTGASFVLLANLQPQVGFYTSQLSAGNPALPAPATTLYVIWSGANDVFANVNNNDPITPDQVAANISTSITNLYNAGGRSFLVPNLPPMGLIPAFVNDPVKSAQATAFVNSYNLLLQNSLDSLSLTLAGIDITQLNANQLFLNMTNNPGEYGFTNVTQPAYTGDPNGSPPYGSVVSNPDQYLYWDNNHGTVTTNAFIAEAALDALSVPEPPTWTLLLGGALLLTTFDRRTRRLAIRPS